MFNVTRVVHLDLVSGEPDDFEARTRASAESIGARRCRRRTDASEIDQRRRRGRASAIHRPRRVGTRPLRDGRSARVASRRQGVRRRVLLRRCGARAGGQPRQPLPNAAGTRRSGSETGFRRALRQRRPFHASTYFVDAGVEAAPVETSTGPVAWTHVWEQEFRELSDVTGQYLGHPAHWAVVDRWFDPECPEVVVRDRVCHTFCAADRAVIGVRRTPG